MLLILCNNIEEKLKYFIHICRVAMTDYTLPVMQSNWHRLSSVYRVLHTLTKTTPQKQKHSILTFEVFQSKVENIQSQSRKMR